MKVVVLEKIESFNSMFNFRALNSLISIEDIFQITFFVSV